MSNVQRKEHSYVSQPFVKKNITKDSHIIRKFSCKFFKIICKYKFFSTIFLIILIGRQLLE